MASSAGTAGIPGGGIAMMAFMLDLLGLPPTYLALYLVCLLYTSDAADERSSVDLGGRRIIKKKKNTK